MTPTWEKLQSLIQYRKWDARPFSQHSVFLQYISPCFFYCVLSLSILMPCQDSVFNIYALILNERGFKYTQARWEVLDLAYNRCEARDKRLLGRDPDLSWCHRHISVKHFWSQSMAPWTPAAAYEYATDCDQKGFTPLSQWYQFLSVSLPNQRPLVLSFTSVVGYAGNFSPWS